MKIQRAAEELRQTNGSEPTINQLSELTGISAGEVAEALCVSQPVISLTSGDDGEAETDIPTESPDDSIIDLLALRQAMSGLDTKDRALLELRYFRELTQSKTAAVLGMTQVQVSRREKKLLTQLRQELTG